LRLPSSSTLHKNIIFTTSQRSNPTIASAKYALPALPYAYDVNTPLPSPPLKSKLISKSNPKVKLAYPHLQALESYISSQIMTLHHTKHHQTYLTNLNLALSSLATASSSSDIITHLHLQSTINFAAGNGGEVCWE
jgi:hypothetical protein